MSFLFVQDDHRTTAFLHITVTMYVISKLGLVLAQYVEYLQSVLSTSNVMSVDIRSI